MGNPIPERNIEVKKITIDNCIAGIISNII